MHLRSQISYTTTFLSKVSNFRKAVLLVFVLGFSWGLQAQTTDNYPVQTTAYCAAPFSQRLSDYFSSDKRLIVNLLLKDLTKPSVQVYLRWQLEGPGIRIGSKDGFVPASFISLQPGVPSKLSGADLAGAYFFPAALQAEGMDVVDAYNLSLPEGFYTISVQAFEASTGQVVSNTSVTFLVLTSPQPPILNLPAIGSQISATSLQKVAFQWTPRHFATAESQVVYQLKVCQVPDDSEPNEQIMLSCTEPRLELTVPNTTLTGDITQWIKPLQVGQRYGVQVRAIDLAGQLNNFSNEGYSQVHWFRYGQPCVPPIFSIKSVSSDRVQLQWQAVAQAQSYLVEYQAEGDVSWTTLKTMGTTQVVSELLSRQTYLFRMRTDCGSLVPSEASEVQRWNIAEDAPEPSPQLPKELLNPELIKVQTSGGVAQTPTSLSDLYSNYPVSNSAQLRIATFSAATTGTRHIPDCALLSGSFSDCQRPHPSVGLPTGGEELGSLKVGDVLGIYDFAVFVTKVKSGSGLAGEGLVRLPFMGNAMALVEFEGVKAKKAQPSDNGGCVYEVSGFFRAKDNVTAQELAQEHQSLVESLLKESDPTAFAGTFEQALKLYDQTVVKLGNQSLTSVQAQPLLIQYLGAILQGSEQLKQQLSELGSSKPEVVALLGDLQKLMDSLQSQLTTLQTTTQTPTVAGLESQYEAIFARIKQLSNTPEVPIENPQSGQIVNVEISKISFNSAHLSWQGSGSIKRYAVVYQIPTLGELTLNTTESSIDLSSLQAGTNYTFRVIGYGAEGQVLDSYGPALFATPAKTLPAPENLTYTVLDDHSVKISWSKNSLHQRFKLSYQDANGETRTLYPSTNSAIIQGLTPDQLYLYDIVAYGTVGSENIASTATTSDFKLGTVCYTTLSSSAQRIMEGASVVLTLEGCQNGMGQDGVVKWYLEGNPTAIFEGSTLTYIPRQTTTFSVTCSLTRSDGTEESCSPSPLTVTVDKKCTGVVATVSSNAIEQGEAVVLRATGCAGDIEWNDGYPVGSLVGNKAVTITYPSKTTTYSLQCVDATGNKCLSKTEIVKKKCELNLASQQNQPFVNFTWFHAPVGEYPHPLELFALLGVTLALDMPLSLYNGIKWLVSGGRSTKKEGSVQAIGCPVPVTWEYSGGVKDNSLSKDNYLYLKDVDKEITVKAICPNGGDVCEKEITISKPKTKCKNFRINISDEKVGGTLYLVLSVESEKEVTWEDGSKDKKRYVLYPKKPTVYTATNSEGCQESIGLNGTNIVSSLPIPKINCAIFSLKAPSSVEIPYDLTSKDFTATMSGCTSPDPGIVSWKWIDPTGKVVATGTGTTANITVKDADKDKTFTLSASCKIVGREVDEETSAKVLIKKLSAPPSPSQLPADPCNFYYWTNRIGNYFLEQTANQEITVFRHTGSTLQAFIEDDKDFLVGSYVVTYPSENYAKIIITTKVGNNSNNTPVTKGQFWVKINHITKEKLVCEGYIQINVDNNGGGSPITLNFTPQTPVKKSGNCVDWVNPELPIIKNHLSWYNFEQNSGISSYGVISYFDSDDNLSRIGIIDKTCTAKTGTFNVYKSSDRTALLSASTIVTYKNKSYQMFIDSKPDLENNKTYYARCTYNGGEYCDLNVVVNPRKDGYSLRIGVAEEETASTEQEASRPCMYAAKEATAVLLQNILCQKLSSLKGDERANLEALRELLAKEGIALPTITDAMVADLVAGNCEKVVADLTKNITGNKPVDELEKFVNDKKANELAGQILELATDEELINTDFNPRTIIGPAISSPVLRVEASACPAYYFSPVGKRIYIPNISNCSYSINGVLMQFERDGSLYIPLWLRSNNAFVGYFKKDVFVQKSTPTGEADVRIAKNTDMVALTGLERLDELSGLVRWQAFMNANKALITNATGEFVTDAEFTTGMAELTPTLASFEDTPLFERVEKFKAPYGPYLFNLDELKAELTALKGTTDEQIAALKAILSNPAYDCGGLGKDAPTICKVYQCVYNALQGTPTLDLLNARLDLVTRKQLITILARDGSLTSGLSPVGGCAFTANGEATILSLIRTTPENDVLALLDYVRSNSDDPQLLRTLISKINYSDLVNALTYVVKSSPAASAFYDKTIPSSEQSLEEHLIVLNKGGIFGTDYIGKEVYDFSYENKKVKVSKRTITGFSQAPAGAPSPTVPVPTYSSPVSYELDPYELVVVVNHSRLSALQGELGVGNGEAVLLPAIALDYVAQQQMQATLLETVNLATIPIGGGQLSAALRAGKSAVALFEAAAIIGAVGQSALDANILPVAYQTQFGALVNSYNTIIGLTGLGIVGGQGLPRLGTWVQRAANSLDSYKIGRSAAQTFLDQLTALKQLQNGQVWQQMLQANRQRLEALAEYLVTKGMKAGEVVVEGIVKARTLADLVKQAKVATLAGFFYVSTSFTGGLLQQAAHLSPQAVEIGLQTINQTDEVLFEATNFANISTSQSRLGSISGLIGQGLPESIERVTLKMAPTAADIQSGTNLQTLAQSQTLRITRAETESLDLVELASLAGVVLLARPKDNQNTDCSICKGIIINGQNRNDVCNSLEALAAKAGLTYKGIIESRLCKANITNLKLAELAGNLQTLNTAYLQRLLTDINESTQLQNNLNGINKPLLTTWQYLFEKHTSRAEFARKDWNTLQQFGKLNERAKALVILFSDGDTKRLINFCADLPKLHADKLFLDFVNDAKNDKYVRGFVKKNLSEEDQQDLEGILADWTKQNDENPEVQKWLLYGENSTRFQQNRTLGNDLSANILAVFKNKTMPYYEDWGKSLGFTMDLANNIDGLKEYAVLDEIPLNTSGGFMKADILLLKRDSDNEVEDAIIIENKLSQNTELTDRQKEGFGAILGGLTFMKLPYAKDGLNMDDNIPVSKNKIFKFYDHGTKDISKVSVIKIANIN